ncbi:MAG: light-harvesting antenna LH1, beta subunit [Pseudomonadales bacterium]|jgi:light-harvesting complex 1 beta chain|nr:light-harvesting antenna LH1, beta subunit [Pseudomonadales bacterium]
MSDEASMSGLSSKEAQEFHSLYMMGFIGFTLVAIVAHFLVWTWRPWLPGEDGYGALQGVNSLIETLAPLVA